MHAFSLLNIYMLQQLLYCLHQDILVHWRALSKEARNPSQRRGNYVSLPPSFLRHVGMTVKRLQSWKGRLRMKQCLGCWCSGFLINTKKPRFLWHSGNWVHDVYKMRIPWVHPPFEFCQHCRNGQFPIDTNESVRNELGLRITGVRCFLTRMSRNIVIATEIAVGVRMQAQLMKPSSPDQQGA